jgi:hypothetical protein
MTLDITTPADQDTLDTHAEEIRDLKSAVNDVTVGDQSRDVENHTANGVLAIADLNKIHTMESAIATILTLPQVTADHIGYWIRFQKLGAGNTTLRAGGSDTFPGGGAGSDALNAAAAEAGQANIYFEVLAAGTWGIVSAFGTWSIT